MLPILEPIEGDVDLNAPLDRRNGTILDSWGNPVWWSMNDEGLFIVWSFGANGKDEQGAGDDIARPWEPVTQPSDDL